jgi:hypothetical protein
LHCLSFAGPVSRYRVSAPFVPVEGSYLVCSGPAFVAPIVLHSCGFAMSRPSTFVAVTLGLSLIGAAAGGYLYLNRPDSSEIDMGSRSECFEGSVRYCIVEQQRSGKIQLPDKTAYWESSFQLDEQSLPVAVAPDGRRFRNMASVAFTMWAGIRDGFDAACAAYQPRDQARAALDYFERSAVPLPDDALTWHYNYDTQINDVVLKAPWASAFAQAAIIERLLLHSCKTGETRYAELARRAGRALALPVTRGGLRSEAEDFVWFQEVPLPDRHNPFIVNAHLYATEVLFLLAKYFPDEGFRELAQRGIQSFLQTIPVVDTNYWNRYDLRPNYSRINFEIKADGLLKTASLDVGELSVVDFRLRRQAIGANGFYQVSELGPGGARLRGTPLLVTFATKRGREFNPRDVREPINLRLVFDGVAQGVRVGTLSIRPGPIEFVALPMGPPETVGAETSYALSLNLGEMNWGQVAPEYIPFHAYLAASIARETADKALFLRAVRWQLFFRRYQEGGARRPREGGWTWTDDAELRDAVWERFGRMRPEDVSDAGLKDLILSLPISAERKAAAFETLPLNTGG